MEQIRRIGRKLKYAGKILKVYEDTMELPDGSTTAWDFIGHPGGACVVPVLPDGRILLVKQFRNAIDRITLELPAGLLDYEGEPHEQCAFRELEEETGYTAERMEHLIDLHSWDAFCSEYVQVFVARDLKPGKEQLDEEEFIDVEAYSLEQVMDRIYGYEITDAKTVAALTAYCARYGR